MASRRSETLHGSLPGRGLGAGRVGSFILAFCALMDLAVIGTLSLVRVATISLASGG